MNRTCESDCRLEARDDPDGSLMDVGSQIFRRVEQPDYQCCIFPPLGALTRANSASEKSVSVYEIALVHLRFEPDTEAIAR